MAPSRSVSSVFFFIAFIAAAAAATAATSSAASRSDSPLSATVIYVSPAGSDASGDGSAAAPFASPARAVAAARALPRPWLADVTVELAAGTYALTETLRLGPDEGGQSGFRLVFTSADASAAAAAAAVAAAVAATAGAAAGPSLPATAAATAVLDGGARLGPTWAVVDAARNIFSARLPGGAAAAARQAWVGGDRVNESYVGNASVYGAQLLSARDSVVTPWGYLTNSSRLVAAARHPRQLAADCELLFRMVGSQWVEERVRVASWELLPDGVTLNISLVQPAFYMLRHKLYVGDFPSHAINLHAALDGSAGAPGEGEGEGEGVPGSGFASVSGDFYYRARAADDMGALDVWVGAVDGPLVSLQGDRAAEPAAATVNDVAFVGITFTRGAWFAPSGAAGYIPDQSGIIYTAADAPSMPAMGHALLGRVPGTLELKAARGVTVEGCVFRNSAASGVTADEGSQRVSVARSFFYDLGCHAVRFGQVDDWNGTDATRFNKDFVFDDNVVFGVAAELRDCSGVMGGYTRNTTISRNSLLNMSWAGVTVGWGWGQHEGALETHGANRIVDNSVTYVNLLTADGGPIYVMGPQRADGVWSEMARNFVGHALHHAALLYHDEGSGWWHTHDNVVNQSAADCVPNGGWWYSYIAAWACSEHDILAEDNWSFELSRTDTCCGNASCPDSNVTVRGSTVVPAGAPWPPAAQAIADAAGATWWP
jgi:hypothetical protein